MLVSLTGLTAQGPFVLRFFLLSVIFLTGCQSLAVDDEARREQERRRDRVRIVEEDAQIDGCERKDEVEVRPPFPMLTKAFPELSSFGSEEVKRDLRYQALLVGGDTVLYLGMEEGLIRGKAFDCHPGHS